MPPPLASKQGLNIQNPAARLHAFVGRSDVTKVLIPIMAQLMCTSMAHFVASSQDGFRVVLSWAEVDPEFGSCSPPAQRPQAHPADPRHPARRPLQPPRPRPRVHRDRPRRRANDGRALTTASARSSFSPG